MAAPALARFSRAAFDESAQPEQLCAELEDLVSARLANAVDRLGEAYAIAAELQRVGHRLRCWDEAPNLSSWAEDDPSTESGARLMVTMRWPTEEKPCQAVEIAVAFRSQSALSV